MKKKVIVVSLGGSLIIPDEINLKYLLDFRKVILRNTRRNKFVIVCGGGVTARKYIRGLEKVNVKNKQVLQSFLGIASTRLNSRFLQYLFFQEPQRKIISKKERIRKELRKNDIVFLYGALKYSPNKTSDSTAAEVAKKLNADFINLTNVAGLYDKNPLKHRNAKFISKISWKDFDKMAQKIKYQPGMHFVLDPTASKIILKSKIPTYILGKNMKNLDNFLKGKKFKGTTIEG